MGLLPWKLPSDTETDPCCCDPEECCLYPWPDPAGTPLYPGTDLPATVVYGGISMAVNAFDYTYFGTGFPPSGGGSTSRQIESGAFTAATAWTVRDGFGVIQEIIGNCLIDGVTVEDEFPDELYAIFTDGTGSYSGYTLFRIGTCVWSTGIDPGSNNVIVTYDASLYKYRADFYAGSTFIDSYTKDDPQNEPMGTYTGGSAWLNIEISDTP